MKKLRVFLAALLIACLVFAAAPISAESNAMATENDKYWNIMLVVDASGSLLKTDPSELRLDAIDQFMDTLNSEASYDGERTTYVGAITFGANHGSNTSDKEMRTGIIVDTGIVPLSQFTATGEKASDWIKKSIRNSDIDNRKGSNTDIGTALLVAQEKLLALDNGNPSAIFLFSDGATALNFDSTLQQSIANKTAALKIINQNGIKLCGVFLNDGGKSSSTEVRDIVCQANGITTTDIKLTEMYIEITDAVSCAGATDRFMALLGYDIKETPEYLTESCTKTFRIPGVGVEEVNIRVRTADGTTLPMDLNISFTDPNGTLYSGSDASAFCSSGRTYRVYKIKNPACGTWQVHITFPEGSKLKVEYSPVLSINIGADLVIEPAAEELHANMSAKVTAVLTQNGETVTDPAAYREYDCTAMVTNTVTGTTETYSVTQNEESKFCWDMPVDYGTYDISIRFDCDDICAQSQSKTIEIVNHAPEGQGITENPEFSIFGGKELTIDISGCFDDIEDGKNLTVEMVSTDGDETALTFADNIITADLSRFGEGETVFRATDSQGESCEFSVGLYPTDLTIRYAIIAAAVVIAVLAAIIIYSHTRRRPDGECQIEFTYNKQETRLHLLPPGSDAPRKTNLWTMVRMDLDKESGFIRSDCRANGVSFSDMQSFLESLAADLKKVSVSAVNGKDGKKKVAKVRVKFGKQSHLLYNTTCTMNFSNDNITLGYYPADNSSDDNNMFGDDFSQYSGSEESSGAFGGSDFDDWGSSSGNSGSGFGSSSNTDSWGSSDSGSSSSSSSSDWGSSDSDNSSSSNTWDSDSF